MIVKVVRVRAAAKGKQGSFLENLPPKNYPCVAFFPLTSLLVFLAGGCSLEYERVPHGFCKCGTQKSGRRASSLSQSGGALPHKRKSFASGEAGESRRFKPDASFPVEGGRK